MFVHHFFFILKGSVYYAKHARKRWPRKGRSNWKKSKYVTWESDAELVGQDGCKIQAEKKQSQENEVPKTKVPFVLIMFQETIPWSHKCNPDAR